MPDFSRNIDIGYPGADTVDVNVKVDEAIGDALKEVTSRLDENAEELRKITLGAGLVTGVDLNEEEVD